MSSQKESLTSLALKIQDALGGSRRGRIDGDLTLVNRIIGVVLSLVHGGRPSKFTMSNFRSTTVELSFVKLPSYKSRDGVEDGSNSADATKSVARVSEAKTIEQRRCRNPDPCVGQSSNALTQPPHLERYVPYRLRISRHSQQLFSESFASHHGTAAAEPRSRERKWISDKQP